MRMLLSTKNEVVRLPAAIDPEQPSTRICMVRQQESAGGTARSRRAMLMPGRRLCKPGSIEPRDACHAAGASRMPGSAADAAAQPQFTPCAKNDQSPDQPDTGKLTGAQRRSSAPS
jgi:hypothetical protein